MEIRKEFEEWAKIRPYSLHRIGDEYKYMATQHAWAGWQASRAGLCVELPDSWIGGEMGDDADLMATVDVKESLELAGVKYK